MKTSNLKHSQLIIIFLRLAAILIVVAFFKTDLSAAADKLNIYVVNYPLQYFAERIGGEHVDVVFPAPADVDPAFWMPDTPTIAAYQQADMILLNGAGYARWVNRVTLPRFRMINTSAGFKERYIEANDIVTHSHGAAGEHAHAAVAFTTWINFSLAAEQAGAIEAVLIRKRPELSDIFQKNFNALEQDLMTIDRTIQEIVSADRTRPLVVSHPVYDYFVSRYGLNVRSVHWEPHEIPTNVQMVDLSRTLKTHPANWMVWEGEPVKEAAEVLKTLGINSLVFDPCGNTPNQGDFLSIMRQNVENLKPAFR